MALIPEDKITDIRNAADIVEIISESVMLKKTGKDYLGLCPFHSEKTPSFTVSPEKQIFHCFGCGMGGNVFTFLMKQDGLSFPEVLKMLAGRYGIDIPTREMSPEQERQIREREHLLSINRQAMAFFQNTLRHESTGRRARDYLNQRGLTPEIIDKFSIGYAPEGWRHLLNFLRKEDIAPAFAEKVGLIVPKKDGKGYYDRFRSRIIFPITDERQQVVGFGGRVLDDSMPKYLNSPETPVYNKSRSLYGLDMARQKCRILRTVHIVEGYLDLLALCQNGIENTVATLGTSLTPAHVRLLKRHADDVILVYDADAAGIKAALRSIAIFQAEEVNALIAVLPEGYDPDSYLSEFGADSFLEITDKAASMMSFLTDSAIRTHGLSVEGKLRIISDMREPLSSVTDSMAKSLYVRELADRLNADEALILEKIETAQTGVGERRGPPPVAEPPDYFPDEIPEPPDYFSEEMPPPPDYFSDEIPGEDFRTNEARPRKSENRMEQEIIAMMLQFPEILPEVRERCLVENFEDHRFRTIGQAILTHDKASGEPVSDLLSRTGSDEQKRLMAALTMGGDFWNREGCLKLISQFEASQNRRDDMLLQEEIKAAEAKKDIHLCLELLKKKQLQVRARR